MAIIRLRAEYLWLQRKYTKIHFNFTNGFRADYLEWMQGKRIFVKGNDVFWIKKTQPSNTPADLWNYLEIIFSYAGTLSLEKELIPVRLAEIQIGDIFIQGGSPGHAVLVADLAVNQSSQKIIFLLLQSYMPAQEIHILKNPSEPLLSPWYSLDFGDTLITPEWTFKSNNFKRFPD